MTAAQQGEIMQNTGTREGVVKRAWARIGKAGLLFTAGAFVAGIAMWGAFNWSLELTNTEEFCISCHEMRENVFKEYRHTIHYTNRSGVRATCPDCHVPKEWGPKIVRKIHASNEVLHKVLGSIDTPEKFQQKRVKLAESEWARMRANDSQECRNCHHFEFMDFSEQGRRAVRTHSVAFSKGTTCIDCHRGIAHQLPPIDQEIGAPRPAGTAVKQ